MIASTTIFDEVINEEVRTLSVEVLVTDSSSNTVTFTDYELVKGSLAMTKKAVPSSFALGSVYIDTCSFSLDKGKLPINYNVTNLVGCTIDITVIAYKTDDDTSSSIKVGHFKIPDGGVVAKKRIVNISAESNINKLEQGLDGVSDDSDEVVTLASGTPYEILSWCCSACGVTLSTSSSTISSMTNGTLQCSVKTDSGFNTYRDVVQSVGELLCAFISCDADGNLVVKPFILKDIADLVSNKYTVKVSEFSPFFRVTKINTKVGKNLYKTGSLSETGDVQMSLDSNPLISGLTSTQIKTSIRNILNALSTIKFYPLSISYNGNPLLEPGDTVSIDNSWEDYDSEDSLVRNYLITSVTWVYRGVSKLECCDKGSVKSYYKSGGDVPDSKVDDVASKVNPTKTKYFNNNFNLPYSGQVGMFAVDSFKGVKIVSEYLYAFSPTNFDASNLTSSSTLSLSVVCKKLHHKVSANPTTSQTVLSDVSVSVVSSDTEISMLMSGAYDLATVGVTGNTFFPATDSNGNTIKGELNYTSNLTFHFATYDIGQADYEDCVRLALMCGDVGYIDQTKYLRNGNFETSTEYIDIKSPISSWGKVSADFDDIKEFEVCSPCLFIRQNYKVYVTGEVRNASGALVESFNGTPTLEDNSFSEAITWMNTLGNFNVNPNFTNQYLIDVDTAFSSSSVTPASTDSATKIADAINNNSDNIDYLKSNMDSVSSNIDTVGASVKTVSDNVETVKGNVTTMSETLNMVSTQSIPALQQSVSSMDTLVQTLGGLPAGFSALESSISGINSAIVNLNKIVASLNARVGDAESQLGYANIVGSDNVVPLTINNAVKLKTLTDTAYGTLPEISNSTASETVAGFSINNVINLVSITDSQSTTLI